MHPSLLQNISQPRDLKRLSSAQIQQLCGEIRQFLLDSVSKTGGHLASNLGAVELTVALHRVFETLQALWHLAEAGRPFGLSESQ